jgi:hypothetical protein
VVFGSDVKRFDWKGIFWLGLHVRCQGIFWLGLAHSAGWDRSVRSNNA